MKAAKATAAGLAGAVAALGVMAAAALGVMAAAANDSRAWPSFRQTDRDSSGAISIDEVRGVRTLADNFALHDKNSDGKLSRAEFEAAKRAGAGDEAGQAAGRGARR